MNYLFEQTEDGSLTVRLKSPESESSEAMHSTKGAFSETLFIYGEAARFALERKWRPSFLSIGLGLGYIEIVLFGLMLRHYPEALERLHLDSYEADSHLRLCFAMWLQSPERLAQEAPLFFQAYEGILVRCEEELKIERVRLHAEMREAYLAGRFRLHGAFGFESWPSRKYSGIFFDAFSAYSAPELWTPELLDRVCCELTEADCIFATYASTGHLKRALQKHGLSHWRSRGFGGKRESTFAVRTASSDSPASSV